MRVSRFFLIVYDFSEVEIISSAENENEIFLEEQYETV